MKCPHCREGFFEQMVGHGIGSDEEGSWAMQWVRCPSCNRFTIRLKNVLAGVRADRLFIVHPKTGARPVPPEVPAEFADDFTEACLVLADSPKASAALSRRCLQHLLVKQHPDPLEGMYTLDDQIQAVIDGKKLPSRLADAIDAVRVIGNFAAHPIKSKSTGEIVEVEPGEADWLLDTLEGLFDFYFVLTSDLQKKRDALNAKLDDAGRRRLKEADGGTENE